MAKCAYERIVLHESMGALTYLHERHAGERGGRPSFRGKEVERAFDA